MRRVQSGQAGENMVNPLAGALGGVPFRYFADWTDRIAKGALPHSRPQRPEGVERNIVVTVWDWLDEKHYLHDLISTDRRFPTVNGYGPVYGAAEYSTDIVPILDPIKNAASSFVAPVRDANTPLSTVRSFAASEKPLAPSPYWGEEVIWDSKANMHNPMIDRQGRVWFTAAIRGRDNPDFCKSGSSHPSAKAFPLNAASRHLSVYDPTPTIRGGQAAEGRCSAGSTPSSSTRRAMPPAPRVGRRSSSTPTVTASETPTPNPTRPPTLPRTCASSHHSTP
jgi:hypothetical protein